METQNNYALVSGRVAGPARYSHHMYGEGFYEFTLLVKRLSEFEDEVPVTVSERLMENNNIVPGAMITVEGQFRSYNKFDGERSRLMLSVFARNLYPYEESENPNVVELVGYICKEPIYRTTPFQREICDLLLAVNRSYNKSDYIPCIAWGRNARFLASLCVGDKLEISGRIQSREYNKQTESGQITKTAYEVSVNKVVLDERNQEFRLEAGAELNE